MLKNISQIKYLPTLAFFLINIIIIGNPLQAIAQRKFYFYEGDIPGKNPGCSIISIDSFTNSELGRELLALEKRMSPEQVDANITGDPTTPYWAAREAEFGTMRWLRKNENRSVELVLAFRYRRLNQINVVMTNGDARCVIRVEE
jgi:hypothetical protein